MKNVKVPAHPSTVLEHLAGADIASGEVIDKGSYILVAGGAIANGERGPVHSAGIFKLPKNQAQGFNGGDELWWDGNVLTTTSTANTPAGLAAEPAGTTDEFALVMIGPYGTETP